MSVFASARCAARPLGRQHQDVVERRARAVRRARPGWWCRCAPSVMSRSLKSPKSGSILVGDDRDARARRRVLVELGEHHGAGCRCSRAPGWSRGARPAARLSLTTPSRRRCRACASLIVSSSSAITMRLSPAAMTVSDAGLSSALPVLHEPDHHRVHERELRVEEGLADQRRLLGEVDLGAVEVEQLGVDDAQAALPAGLHHDAADQVVGEHPVRLVRADQAGRLEVARILQLADDVVLAVLALRVVGDRERGLDDDRVGVVVVLGGEHDDAAGGVGVRDLELGEVHRVARAHDDLASCRVFARPAP